MRLLSLVLSLVLGVSGCTPHNKTPAYAIGGTAAVAGVAVFAIAAAQPDCDPEHPFDAIGCEASKGWMYIGSALLLAIGLTAIGVAASIDTGVPEAVNPFLPAQTAEPAPAPASEDPQLRELTLQASLAAAVGRCDQVSAIAITIDELDRGYRIAGFVRDPKIRACLR